MKLFLKTIILTNIIMTLGFINSVYANDGEAIFNKNCVACDGAKGGSPISSSYPRLQGQNADYLVKQIKDFQSGKRKDSTMQAMANMIVGKERAVANYLAVQ